ncbi:MAG: ATP-binding protein [Candidatus Aenigmatarchaeota archaeon]
MEVGTVISLEPPSTIKFYFSIKKYVDLKKGQYVKVETEEGELIALVEEIFKENKYYSNPEYMEEVNNFGFNIEEQFPTEMWECSIAKAYSLGVLEKGNEKRVNIAPSPGSKVYLADSVTLRNFFGLDENGLNIGELSVQGINVSLNLTKLFKKHLSVLGISGSGKSHFISVLIEELLSKDNSPAIIVIDPHGEYVSFSQDERFSYKTKIWNKENISFATYNIGVNSFAELIPEMSGAQKRDLSRVLERLKNRKIYGMEDLIDEIEKEDIKRNVKDALISWLLDLSSTRLFLDKDSPSIDELAQLGKLSVVDLSSFVNLKEKQIVVARITRMLFEERRRNKIPPFILIIEEAHNFAPERKEELAISKSVIEQVAREGRKFFACLVLISQRPVKLSTTALSQCNTQVIFKITNPYDLRHIAESSEKISEEVIRMISGLKVGEAFIVGEATSFPIMIKIRRKSVKEIKDKSLEEALEDFYKNKKEYVEFYF